MDESRLRPSSYDMTIGKIIDSRGYEIETLDLEPQKMVLAISAEMVHLPNNIVGYVLPKQSLHNAVVLSLSTGISDPGYEGLLSSTLINFGSESFTLKKGDPFIRIAFLQILGLDDPQLIEKSKDEYNIAREKYLSDHKAHARTFPDTFLDIPGHARRIANEVAEARVDSLTKVIGQGATIIVILTLVVSIVAFLGAPIVSETTTGAISARVADRVAVSMQKEHINPLEKEVSQLRGEVDALQAQQLKAPTEQGKQAAQGNR